MVTTSWTYSTSLHSYTCSIAHLLDSLTHFHSFHLNNSSHSLTHSRSLNHSLVLSLSAMFLNEKNCRTITQSLTHSRLLTHTYHTHSTHFSTLTAPNFTHLLICWNRVDTKKSDQQTYPKKPALITTSFSLFFFNFYLLISDANIFVEFFHKDAQRVEPNSTSDSSTGQGPK